MKKKMNKVQNHALLMLLSLTLLTTQAEGSGMSEAEMEALRYSRMAEAEKSEAKQVLRNLALLTTQSADSSAAAAALPSSPRSSSTGIARSGDEKLFKFLNQLTTRVTLEAKNEEYEQAKAREKPRGEALAKALEIAKGRTAEDAVSLLSNDGIHVSTRIDIACYILGKKTFIPYHQAVAAAAVNWLSEDGREGARVSIAEHVLCQDHLKQYHQAVVGTVVSWLKLNERAPTLTTTDHASEDVSVNAGAYIACYILSQYRLKHYHESVVEEAVNWLLKNRNARLETVTSLVSNIFAQLPPPRYRELLAGYPTYLCTTSQK